MAIYCTICGKELHKSLGPIGPKCLQKIMPRNKRRTSIRTEYKTYYQHHEDFFGDLDDQEKNDRTSQDTTEQKTGPNGQDRPTTT